MKGLKKKTDLYVKVNSDDLIYWYRRNIDNVKFDEFDNAFGFIDKIQDDKTEVVNVKNDQEKFKTYLGNRRKQIKRTKKRPYTTLNCFAKQETKLLNFMIIIL